MKEAIGTSFVFSMIMVFTGVMIALVVGSISYSKSFKIRNRIIDIVEKHYGYNDIAKEEIEENLSTIGYRIVDRECPARETEEGVVYAMDPKSDYYFCIYQHQADRGHYYGVLVYMHFDIPLIGEFLQFPIYGETRTIFDTSIEG